ncbi:MAG: hypothetical protein ABL957_03480 [Parvularculaceae bacterium]
MMGRTAGLLALPAILIAAAVAFSVAEGRDARCAARGFPLWAGAQGSRDECGQAHSAAAHEPIDLSGVAIDGWEAARFGDLEVKATHGSLLVEVDRPQAGILLRAHADPALRYKLTISGAGRNFRLRVLEDGAARGTVAAPADGAISLIVGEAAEIEALLFSDGGSFMLDRISLDPCPDCPSKADLRRRIEEIDPEIDEKEGIDQAIALLKWSANVANWAFHGDLTRGDVEAMAPEDALYNVFDAGVSGVMCGGQADFFAKVLREFGFDAFTVGFGIEGDLNHVSVILALNGSHYLLDPTFAGYYARDGAPAPLDELLVAMGGGGDFGYDFVELGLERRKYLDRKLAAGFCDRRERVADGVEMCRQGRGLLRDFLDENRTAIAEAGLPPDGSFLLALLSRQVLNLDETLDATARARFEQKLSALSSPVRSN